MKIHHFNNEDLRILASLAIDLHTDHLFFKCFRIVQPEENYWSLDCRFAVSEDEFETRYDSLHLSCGRDNDPSTYQMSWNYKNNHDFKVRPITSPLVVVHFLEEICKKASIKMN